MNFGIVVAIWLFVVLCIIAALMRSAIRQIRPQMSVWSATRTMYFFSTMGVWRQDPRNALKGMDGPDTLLSDQELAIFRKCQQKLLAMIFVVIAVGFVALAIALESLKQ